MSSLNSKYNSTCGIGDVMDVYVAMEILPTALGTSDADTQLFALLGLVIVTQCWMGLDNCCLYNFASTTSVIVKDLDLWCRHRQPYIVYRLMVD